MTTYGSRSGHARRRAAAPHALPFILAALIALAGVVATYQLFVNRTEGQFIDESALTEAAVARHYLGVQASQWLDALPLTSVVIAAFVVLFVTLARRRWKAAGIALLAMGAANLSTQLIKAALPNRPDLGVDTLSLNSLPSGHSTLAASAAVAVFLVVSPRWRPAAGFLGGTYAVVSGVSTLVNQWHRPADVLAAFFVVAFWGALAALAVMRTGNAWNVWAGPREHWASSAWWTIGAAGLAVLTIVGAYTAVASVAAHPQTSRITYFLAGAALIAACGYALTMFGALLLGSQARRRAR
nr:phosphatase PAP2 family protein [Specibacter cremeus]